MAREGPQFHIGGRGNTTTKLTRRRKPERRELATKAQAVGGRVQRLVVPMLVALQFHKLGGMNMKNQILSLIVGLIIFGGCSQEKPMPIIRQLPAKKPTPVIDPVRYRLYIPTAEGKLYKRVEDNPRLLLTHEARSGPAFEWSEEAATEAIKRLLKAAPDKFPPGTKLVSGISSRGGLPKANFNRAFAEPNWWKEPIRAKSAIYALVNTAVITKETIWPSSGEESLTFYVDGKPLGRLGNFDFSKPFDRDESLVQPQ